MSTSEQDLKAKSDQTKSLSESDLSQSLVLELAISEHRTKEEAEAQENIDAVKAAEIAAADSIEAVEIATAADRARKAKRNGSDKSSDSDMQESSDSDSEWRQRPSQNAKKKSRKNKNKSKGRKKDKFKLSKADETDSPELQGTKSKIRYSSVTIDERGQFQNNNILKLMNLKSAEIDRLKAAVKDKNPGAMLDYATCYRYGYCKLTPNKDKAFGYLIKVAESSNPDCVLVAKWLLSEYYSENHCFKTNSLSESDRKKQALHYLKEAADGGLAVAINDLGYYYEITENLPEAMLVELLGREQGQGLKTPDEMRRLRYQRAYELYEKAANLRLNHAEYNLAQCFFREDFYVPEKYNNKEDREKNTQYWLLRAANNRYNHAINELEARYPELYAKCYWKNKTQKTASSSVAVNASKSVGAQDKEHEKESAPKRKRWDHDILSSYQYIKRRRHKKDYGQEPALPEQEEQLRKLTKELHPDRGDPKSPMSSSSSDEPLEKSPKNASDSEIVLDLTGLLSSSSSSSEASMQEELAEKFIAIRKEQLRQIERLKALGSELEKENAEDEKTIQELEARIAELEAEEHLEEPKKQKNIQTKKFA